MDIMCLFALIIGFRFAAYLCLVLRTYVSNLGRSHSSDL